ncbi:MAG: tyrosine-type recombinase/integrase [Chloroflexota bacterium]
MPSKTKTQPLWTLASVALQDAYTDFILSRQAKNCTPATMEFYRYTAGVFLAWIVNRDILAPAEVTARHVREYLAHLADKADTTRHDHARAIRTLLRFWHTEGYTPTLVKFDMPKLSKKRLPVLTTAQLLQIVKVCNVRDKAIILFMADSGLRRGEVCALNWQDVDIQSGLVRVRLGKGRKDRSAVIGATTRRALLAYRRTLADRDGVLFQAKGGTRFTGSGLLTIFRRLSKRTGIHVTPHAMRRTFTILALRAGMNALTLQSLLGHEDLTMVKHYAQMVDDDLLTEHRAHSPVDNLKP